MAKRWLIGEDRQLVEYGTQPFVWEPAVVLESDYDALARDLAACKIARDECRRSERESCDES